MNSSGGGNYSEMFMKDMFLLYEKYIFPYDRRYGVFQGLYNALKRAGLGYYMFMARRPGLSGGARFAGWIKYWPFHLYRCILDKKADKSSESD